MTKLPFIVAIALAAVVSGPAAQAGAPLKGVDVKLGKTNSVQAKTKSLAKPAKAVAKGEPHRPISR